jgi:integrase
VSVHEHTYTDGTTGYVVRWREHGRNRSRRFDPRQLGGVSAARKAAKQFDRHLTHLSLVGTTLDRGSLTLAAMADQWWDRHATRRCQPSTLDSYATQLDVRILPRWAHTPLRDITPAAVDHWTQGMVTDGVGAPTIRKTLAVLQGILRLAVVDGHIDSNPVTQVYKPPATRQRDPIMVGPDLIERARAHLLTRGRLMDATLLVLLAYTGMRPESEGVLLRWDHVKRRHINVHETKRGARTRRVNLLPPLADDLHAWREYQRNPIRGPVFPGPWDGHHWDNWRDRVFRPALLAAGATPDTTRRRRGKDHDATSIRPRDLRSTFASLLIWEGRSIVDVATQLGHSPETCLRVYAGVLGDFDPIYRRDAADVIADAREAACSHLVPTANPNPAQRPR